MYLEAIAQMSKQLGQIDKWLDAAVAYAEQKKFDPNLYLGFRLAPDQFGFGRQVQIACDTAKQAAARLAGKEAPAHPDTETTIPELRARIQSVRTYLGTFTAKDFEGAETRKVPLPFLPGGNKGALGTDYLVHFAQPNFYFHLVHAYAILRHNGVPLGKRDFLGPLTQTMPA